MKFGKITTIDNNEIDNITSRPNDYKLQTKTPYNFIQKLSDDQFPILLENLEKIGDEKPLVFMIIIPSHPILEQSKIINIAMARTMYSPTLGKIVSIEGTYNGYQYPDNIGVDEVILKYSNLSKDFLIGKTFDEDKIDKLLQGKPTLITYVDTKINLNNKEFNYGNLFDSHFPQYNKLKILNYCTDYNWFLDTETDLGNHKIQNQLLSFNMFTDIYNKLEVCIDMIYILNSFKTKGGEEFLIKEFISEEQNILKLDKGALDFKEYLNQKKKLDELGLYKFSYNQIKKYHYLQTYSSTSEKQKQIDEIESTMANNGLSLKLIPVKEKKSFNNMRSNLSNLQQN